MKWKAWGFMEYLKTALQCRPVGWGVRLLERRLAGSAVNCKQALASETFTVWRTKKVELFTDTGR